MSQQFQRNFESKQVHTTRNIGSNSHLSSHKISAESQMRGGTSRQNYQVQQTYDERNPLNWEGIHNSILYRNGSDFQQLLSQKNILLDLINQFEGKDKVVFQGNEKDAFKKRLLLLEGQIQGLLKRKIMFSSPDYKEGTRQLDYTVILSEKENQVAQLQKKIQNIQERLRRMQGRQIELENEIVFLNQHLRRKNDIIQHKDLALSQQVSFSRQMAAILQKIRRSNQSKNIIQDLVIPSLDISDIKLLAKNVSESRSYDNQVVKLFRQFESLKSQKGSKATTQSIIEGWIMGLPKDSPLRLKLSQGERKISKERRYLQMEEKLGLAGEIYRAQLQRLKSSNPGMRIEGEDQIFSILKNQSSSALRVKDVIQIERIVQKKVQIPVQDSRTKHLIYLLATNYKKLFTKYPKLYDQMDGRLAQFFSQELIDIIEVDQVDRIVQIVKYVPQVVKVQNVYAYSSQKSRKVEFHLRVLIKALLQQMQKMKIKSGVIPEIDEGVISMIRQQIMEFVDVDDILKVYRVTPKIVEVQKIVQRIVQKIVQVPKIVEVQRRVQVPVQVIRYEVVQNTVNVPFEVPKFETLVVQRPVHIPTIQQRIVTVPQIFQRIVEVIKQVPKQVKVQKTVQKIVQVQRVVEVIKEKIVPKIEYRNIELIKEKIVPIQKIVYEKPIQVQRIIEKIVPIYTHEKITEVVPVQVIVQKIVQRVQYLPAPQIRNHIEIRYEPVDRIVEKIVQVQKIVKQIVEVPQIIQKIVPIYHDREVLKQVEVIVQKIVFRDRIKQVQKIIEIPLIQVKQIIKTVELIKQVPVIQEVIKIETITVEKPVVERIEKISYKEVVVEKPVIMYQDRIKEVDRIVNHFIKEPQVITIIEDRIVPVEKIIERVKTVPTIIEKIIEKLVEVPKVVEVQKIVERIVVVPRIIEKIVQVPQIVEKIVQRMQIVQEIVQVQKRVMVPVIQQVIKEVEVVRNVYIQVDRPVDVVRQILKTNQIIKTVPEIHQIVVEKAVFQKFQIPKTLVVQKIVTHDVMDHQVVKVRNDIIVPMEIQVPVDRIIQKSVPVQHVYREIQQIDRLVENKVYIKETQTKIQPVERKVDNIVIQQRIKQVQKIVPYFQDRIREVHTERQKIVPVERVIYEIKQVQQMVEKVIDRIVQIPKVYEIEKLVDRRVDVPHVIEVEKIIPQIIYVNQYIDRIISTFSQIPFYHQQLMKIDVDRQKIVAVKTEKTNIVEVDKLIEKKFIVQKIVEVQNQVHLIENTLKLVDKIIHIQSDPVFLNNQSIVQVPHIIQKIVQKIVIMPQIVQVLKYVHQIAEKQTLGLAVGAQIGVQEIKYKDLGNGLRSQMELLLVQLRKMKSGNPSIRIQIQIIEKFLAQFQTYLLYPRIHEVIKQVEVNRIVEKDRAVLIPVQSHSNFGLQLSKTVLIEKLIAELKLFIKESPNRTFYNLDDDIIEIFFTKQGANSKFTEQKFMKQMDQFSNSVQRKFSQMGGWSTDHQIMLNSFLQQRFLMANVVKNANQQIKKTKIISEKRLDELKKTQHQRDQMAATLKLLKQIIPGIMSLAQKQKSRKLQTDLSVIVTSINSMLSGNFFKGEPTRKLDQMVFDARIKSLIREKDDLILELTDRLKRQGSIKQDSHFESRMKQLIMQKSRIQASHSKCVDKQRRYLEEIQSLSMKIKQLKLEIQRMRVMSPKESINTIHSINTDFCERITSPIGKRTETKIQISRRSDKSESDSSSYGVNYNNYHTQETSNYDGEEKIYKSSYQVAGKHLMSGSEVGTIGGAHLLSAGGMTSAMGGNMVGAMNGSSSGGRIGSHQFILGTQSRTKGEIEGGHYTRMQMSSVSSSGNVVNSGGKTYEKFYQSRYQQRKD